MIGIFDSGVGGLTVVKELFKQLPERRLVYFGDTARTPYGNKSPQTIIKYAKEDTEFLLKHGATVIVIGCNTASAEAADDLKKSYPELPIFEVITPAVKKAAAVTKNKRIGVIGTRGTINSGIYERLLKQIDPRIKVFHQACPLFVPIVEENWIKQPETKMIARRYLHQLKQEKIDTLILGCTHYPLLKAVISAKIGTRVHLVDPAVEVVLEIAKQIPSNGNSGLNSSQFYVSDLTAQVQTIAQRWLGQEIKLQLVNGIGG